MAALSRLPSPPARGSSSPPRVKPSKENSFLTAGMFGDTITSEDWWEQRSLCNADPATFSRAGGLAAHVSLRLMQARQQGNGSPAPRVA